jgi:hypothetical protein
MLDVVDHHHIYLRFSGVQLQPKLLLNSGD